MEMNNMFENTESFSRFIKIIPNQVQTEIYKEFDSLQTGYFTQHKNDRRSGTTTALCVMALKSALENSNTNISIISPTHSTSLNIRDVLQSLIDNKNLVSFYTTDKIKFNNGSTIQFYTENSIVYIRGTTQNFIFVDLFDHFKESIVEILAPISVNAKVIMATTIE